MLPNGITVIRDESYFKHHYNRDRNLSLKAKGLLGLVLTLPPSWEFSIQGLITICLEEESAIRTTIRELRDKGYCHYARIRNEKQQVKGTHYIFFDIKQTEKPNGDFPHQAFPNEGFPNEENQGQYNKEVLNNNINKGGGAKKGNVTKIRLPPAVSLWLQKTGLGLSERAAKLIESRVKNLPAWEATLEGWLANPNWSPSNIDGQLNRYDKKVREGDYPKELTTSIAEVDPDKAAEDEILRSLIYDQE